MNKPFAGNIEFSLGEGIPHEAYIAYSSRGFEGLRRLITFSDAYFRLSPMQWEAVDIEYDYESVSHKLLHKVNKWRPFWKVTMSYGDRDTWIAICRNVMSLMNSAGHVFSADGVQPNVRFWLFPVGDDYRPRIEVILVNRDTPLDEYWGGRYIGFGQFEFIIKGAEVYDEQYIPSRYVDFPVVSGGIIAPVGSTFITSEVF